MSRVPKEKKISDRALSAFAAAFVFACFLFWWLPSAIFRLVDMADPITDVTLVLSLLSVVLFSAGYILPPLRFHLRVPACVMDDCNNIAYRISIWIAPLAVFLALQFFYSRTGVQYGQGEGIPITHQAVLYVHMFFAFLFLGTAREEGRWKRQILIICLLVSLPRFIISLRWGRFFLAQAVVPIVFIALARGWLLVTPKRVFQLVTLALTILFVPALTRGDLILGADSEVIQFFALGSTLRLFQDNQQIDLQQHCPPLLVSITAKTVPYSELDVCTVDLWGMRNLPATLDRILTLNEPASQGTLLGTGANYLLELYVSGGIMGILIGSLFFGMTSRWFLEWIAHRSLFAGIWAECLSRALLAPRSTLGYVYERIPSLVVVTVILVMLVWFLRMQKLSYSGITISSDVITQSAYGK